jgi:hypothetical protein
MNECARCGKCCCYMKRGKVVACKYLIKFKNITVCRIYKNRLGVVTDSFDGNIIQCMMRNQSPVDYKGCPMNSGKPINEDIL